MTRTLGRRSGRIGAAVLATLCAVLFAMFAVHGVAAHGVSHAGGSHSAVPSAAPSDAHHAGAGLHEDRVADHWSGADGHLERGSAAPDDLGGAVDACLAILCPLLIALIVMAVRRRQPHRPTVVLRRIRTRLIVRARPVEPPCLHRLSILRC